MEIPYYKDYISETLRDHLLKEGKAYPGVDGLIEVGKGGGLENTESFQFLCQLYDKVKNELGQVLSQREIDRDFIDKRTKACYEFNQTAKNDFVTPEYKTVIGLEDAKGRIVIGPKIKDYYHAKGEQVAQIPEFLEGNHITLFGPPESAKLSINAMNAYHRKLKDEPAVVSKLLATHESVPKWGADDEDSKTPLRADLASAGENLTECFDGTLKVEDKKIYELAKEKLSVPIKRFPGLALPCSFLFYRGNPIPLHLYDFALHLFKNWHNPKALAFYVPKLENEEEARYIKYMMESSEKLIKKLHPEYVIGTIKLLIVLENPRAVFRANEIIDELYPYFAGASLGWHDYLATTARIFKEDPNYRIPVKADPDIVIKHVKASHQLLADVVGKRGGIKIGGMYGILPISNDLKSDSFQVSILGFIKDIVTQMKRGLDGFWVAHPDFMRIGMALVEGWKQKVAGDSSQFDELIKALLNKKFHKEIFSFIDGKDIKGLEYTDELYGRSLIIADIKESDYIRNNDPKEIRYNVFQTLQYLTDWLCGNGCVALPALVDGQAVRVMDDLATCERSRWEVWHEIHHGRFSLDEFFKIAHEELHFIRKDLSDDKKIVQVKWNERTEKWYPVALNLMIKLMTDSRPVEFATELLMPFTVESIRNSDNPWQTLSEIDSEKVSVDLYIKRFNHFFEMCGCLEFAQTLGKTVATDIEQVENLIMAFDKNQIIEAASFHGDIGQSKKTLDSMAKAEQGGVSDAEGVNDELIILGQKYQQKHGIKFLVSAKGKSGTEMLSILKERIDNPNKTELLNAKIALFEITKKRLDSHPLDQIKKKVNDLLKVFQLSSLSMCVTSGIDQFQQLSFNCSDSTLFEIASLSKTLGTFYALNQFKEKGIDLSTSVNKLLEDKGSTFRLKGEFADKVELQHLMSHSALNMHYVNGVPATEVMPSIEEFLEGNEKYGYEPITVINEPGTKFQYSGAGFMLLQHLVGNETKEFFRQLGMTEFSFEQKLDENLKYAKGYLDSGKVIEGGLKVFPAFAAGAFANAHSVSTFLNHLTKSYKSSDNAAVAMLTGTDKGCQEFMGANMGLGVFIAEAGLNKLAIHQGANDGFRAIYVHCFDGPDVGKGFTLLCNGDNAAVLCLSKIAQLLLNELNFEGIDYSKFIDSYDTEKLSQEELVNIGYKKLVFDAFEATLPEAIKKPGPLDSFSDKNLMVGATVEAVTNQRFARVENLVSPYTPVFDPEEFGEQGKIMDSWESARHNQEECDQALFKLKRPAAPKYISLSTKYHLGNQASEVRVEGLFQERSVWVELLPKTKLEGHALKQITLADKLPVIEKVRVSIYPDGGLSRVGLYEDLTDAEAKNFDGKSIVFQDEIPHTLKPMHIPFSDISPVKPRREDNIASALFGAKVVSSSNEHYGPASQVISPFPPISMFDGLESARSREVDHHDEVVIEFARPSQLSRIDLDFTYFVNNNPLEIEVLGLVKKKWVHLINRQNVKGYASKIKKFDVFEKGDVTQIKVLSYPDGGINRIKAYS